MDKEIEELAKVIRDNAYYPTSRYLNVLALAEQITRAGYVRSVPDKEREALIRQEIQEAWNDSDYAKKDTFGEFLERAAKRVLRFTQPTLPQAKSYWWCPRCYEEKAAQRVTNQELCDDCGEKVVALETHPTLPEIPEIDTPPQGLSLQEGICYLEGAHAQRDLCLKELKKVGYKEGK